MPCGLLQEYQFELRLTNTDPNDPRAPLRTDTFDPHMARKKLEAFAHLSMYEKLRFGWAAPGHHEQLAECPPECPRRFFLFGLTDSYFKLEPSDDQPEHGCDWDYQYTARAHIAVYCLKDRITLNPVAKPGAVVRKGCGAGRWEQSMETVRTGPVHNTGDLDDLSYNAEQSAIEEMFWATAQVDCPPRCKKQVSIWRIESVRMRQYEDPETGAGMAEIKVKWYIRIDCVPEDTTYKIGRKNS